MRAQKRWGLFVTRGLALLGTAPPPSPNCGHLQGPASAGPEDCSSVSSVRRCGPERVSHMLTGTVLPGQPHPPHGTSRAATACQPVPLSTERSAVYPAKKPKTGSTACAPEGTSTIRAPASKDAAPVLPEDTRPGVLKIFSHNKYPKSGLGAVIITNPEKTPWHNTQREQHTISTHTVPHVGFDPRLSSVMGTQSYTLKASLKAAVEPTEHSGWASWEVLTHVLSGTNRAWVSSPLGPADCRVMPPHPREGRTQSGNLHFKNGLFWLTAVFFSKEKDLALLKQEGGNGDKVLHRAFKCSQSFGKSSSSISGQKGAHVAQSCGQKDRWGKKKRTVRVHQLKGAQP